MTRRSIGAFPTLLILLAALIPYAPTLLNGFAGDDEYIVATNPAVTAGDLQAAFTTPYWPEAYTAGTLYRPLTTASFAAEWRLWGGNPAGFHALNLILHAAVSFLVLGLLRGLGVAPLGALFGALLFAVHPVHSEAVAQVVGRSELLAALAYLTACLAFLRRKALWAVPFLFLLGLGAKEIAVTLPLALILIEAGRPSHVPLGTRLRERALVFGGMALALGAYLAVRFRVTGGMVGETPAPEFHGLGPLQRIMTALSAWIDYVRLLVFPLDLSSDYSPAVRFPALTLDRPGIVGGLIFMVVVALAVVLWRKNRPVSVGLAWLVLVVLPVSNLFLPTGTLLAERTLYLPSVGFALLVAQLVAPGLRRRAILAAAMAALVALSTRTVVRTLDWKDSATMMAALERDHPESVQVVRKRARDAMAEGRWADAATEFELALHLSPHHYTSLTEAALFYEVVGRPDRSRQLLEHAIEVSPETPHAHRILARVAEKARGARRTPQPRGP